MKKEFNDTGICNPKMHYMADISKKVDKIFKLVEKGKYFTINRPRQYGKSTTSRILRDRAELEGYASILISFEGIGDSIFRDEAKFSTGFLELLADKLEKKYPEIAEYITNRKKEAENLKSLSKIITNFIDRLNKKLVLIIDEVDKSSNNQLFLSFLGLLRGKYLEKDEESTFYSVILIGVHDVKTLKLKLNPDEEQKYNSPWNIAADFDVDMSFSEEEIISMLEEYKSESGVDFDIDYFGKKLKYYTSGHPFLVSKVCKIIDEEIKTGNKWEYSFLEEAIKILLKSSIANFDELTKNLENNQKLRNFVQELVLGNREFAFELSVFEINLGYILGILNRNENNQVKIHNKIYEEKITNYLTGRIEIEDNDKSFLFIKDKFIKSDGRLDMKKVLLKFQEAIKEKYSDSDLFKSNEFLEKDLRMMFLVFLKPIINGVGFSFKEVQTSAEKRLDIIVIFRDEKFVIELKLWYGQQYHEEGIMQIKDYMARENVDEGYMLIMSKLKDRKFDTEEKEGIFMVWV